VAYERLSIDLSRMCYMSADFKEGVASFLAKRGAVDRRA